VHYPLVLYSRVNVSRDVAKKLRASRLPGESASDAIDRLIDDTPASNVAGWLESLLPLEGAGVFTPEERGRLKGEQQNRRDSHSRKAGR
jgi:hypothetical protein